MLATLQSFLMCHRSILRLYALFNTITDLFWDSNPELHDKPNALFQQAMAAPYGNGTTCNKIIQLTSCVSIANLRLLWQISGRVPEIPLNSCITKIWRPIFQQQTFFFTKTLSASKRGLPSQKGIYLYISQQSDRGYVFQLSSDIFQHNDVATV